MVNRFLGVQSLSNCEVQKYDLMITDATKTLLLPLDCNANKTTSINFSVRIFFQIPSNLLLHFSMLQHYF